MAFRDGLIEGRRAIVTGGGSGIGRAIARALAGEGASVVVVGRSESVDEVAAEADAQGLDITPLRADLTDRTALRRGWDEAVARLGGLDVLVNSHGVATSVPTVDHTLEAWDRTIETNLTSVFELCQLAGRGMVDQGWGKIINIASMYAYFGGVRVAAYTASKGGVAQLTKALANEWAPAGVNVNAIAPGYVRTDLNRHVWQDPERSAEILSRLPAGRWADPEDVGGPAVFLASPMSDYLHGIVLPVDGGFLAR